MKNASRMMDCSGYIKLNISCHNNLYVFTQYTAFFNREAKTRDFTCPDSFKFEQIMFNSLILTWQRNFEVTFDIFSTLVFQISVLESYLDIYLF